MTPRDVGAEPASHRSILNREVVAWALYDWGGAAFSAVITTFVFTVYLTSSGFGSKDHTSEVLGHGMTIAGIVIALLAPITGQRADRAGRRTFWLGVNSLFVLLISASLFFIRPQPGYLWWGVALIGLGNVFHEFAAVNYNALLPRVSTPATMGRISAIGWGSGYLGGIVLLGFLFVAFINPAVGLFGVTKDDGMNVRVSMLFAAAWFGLSMIPLLLTVRDRPADVRSHERVGILASYAALWRTLSGLWRSNRHVLFFLLASAVFRDGLAGVFTFGGVLAAGTFGFTPSDVLIFGIAANVVAGIATVSMGSLDDILGPKRVIVISLTAMIIAGVGIFVFHDRGPMAFWILGLALCIWVGPAQSASRTYLARLIPAGREGEIFGLYATTGRAVSPLAPALWSWAIVLGGSLSPGGNAQRWGILGIMVVLAAGLALLLFVHPTPPSMDHADA